MNGIERHWKEVEEEEDRLKREAQADYLRRARAEYDKWLAAKPACAQLFEQQPFQALNTANSLANMAGTWNGLLGGAFGNSLGGLGI